MQVLDQNTKTIVFNCIKELLREEEKVIQDRFKDRDLLEILGIYFSKLRTRVSEYSRDNLIVPCIRIGRISQFEYLLSDLYRYLRNSILEIIKAGRSSIHASRRSIQQSIEGINQLAQRLRELT